MIFTVFFIIIESYLIWAFSTSESNIRLLLVWPIINMLNMSIAYGFNSPKLILGKSKDGKINKALLILNFPWLLLTWAIFKIQATLSRENIFDNIAGTTIWISCRPPHTFDYSQFDIVVDLTAEFPKDNVSTQEYLCYPNLDGMPLTTVGENLDYFGSKKILVHCANGHGRSALFVANVLKSMSVTKNMEQGLELIKSCRPQAYPNKSQVKNLKN